MPLLLTDAIRDTRTLLGEVSAVRWTDADMIMLLDLGQKHVAGLTLGYQRQVAFRDTDATDVFLPGRRDYALAGTVGAGGLGLTDVLAIQQIYLNDNELAQVIPKAVPTWNERARGTGTPAGWYEFAEVLTFLPIPNSAFLASYDVLVIYAALPTDWTTGLSVLPEGIADLTVWFAAALAFYSVNKYADALSCYQQYMAYADGYKPVAAEVEPTVQRETRMPNPHPGAAPRRRPLTQQATS